MISIIAAVAENGIIGKNNDLPWKIPADLSYFAKTTKSRPVVMGLTTFKSILSRLGRPLSGRKNVVLVFEKDPTLTGCEQVTSLPEAFELADTKNQEVFVIGGASVYRQSIDFADRLYITRIHASPDGDTSFPEIEKNLWNVISLEDHTKDGKNQYDYSFVIYERRKQK
jgi:dihydrofolate reductase